METGLQVLILMVLLSLICCQCPDRPGLIADSDGKCICDGENNWEFYDDLHIECGCKIGYLNSFTEEACITAAACRAIGGTPDSDFFDCTCVAGQVKGANGCEDCPSLMRPNADQTACQVGCPEGEFLSGQVCKSCVDARCKTCSSDSSAAGKCT